MGVTEDDNDDAVSVCIMDRGNPDSRRIIHVDVDNNNPPGPTQAQEGRGNTSTKVIAGIVPMRAL
jgi:hypothetical protein